MRSAASIIVVLGSGCAQLFSLDPVPHDARLPTDAALIDAALIDAPDGGIATVDAARLCANPNADIPATLIADTWLGPTAQGSNELLYGGPDGHILLKFDTFGYDVASLSLYVDAASFSKECDLDGGTCTSCTGSNGDYNIYLSRTDWTEADATNTTRDGLNPWGTFAATGTEDRADLIVATFLGTAIQHARTFGQGSTRPFLGPTIAFHIESAGATRSFFSREAVGCNNDTPIPPRLVFRCR